MEILCAADWHVLEAAMYYVPAMYVMTLGWQHGEQG